MKGGDRQTPKFNAAGPLAHAMSYSSTDMNIIEFERNFHVTDGAQFQGRGGELNSPQIMSSSVMTRHESRATTTKSTQGKLLWCCDFDFDKNNRKGTHSFYPGRSYISIERCGGVISENLVEFGPDFR